MSRVSLKTIADLLGVSTASVSIVLSGKDIKGRVSKETSKRILETAKELNYIPNTLAKGLRMGSSKTIGLVVADISNLFFGTLALYIQECAEKEGYAVIIVNTNEKLRDMKKMIKLLKARQVDGLIITPTEHSENLIYDLSTDNIPIVLVDRTFPDLQVNSVLINNYEVSYKSIQRLISEGCKNIALLTYKQNQYHLNERKRGYIDALSDANMYKPENIKEVRLESLKEDIEISICDLLGKKDKVDGIFFTTNSISINGVKSMLKNKVSIPTDIQIMCFDESDAFYLLPYEVPFIKQPIEEMAKESMRLLLANIKNGKHNERIKNITIDAKLMHN